ncbi:glutaredoxin family protein [Massilia sp. S19_KUP03_FR1]|uniref:glutaredoxin family protein n=1 Tax=Massilia sp. S19_KUP03_FR1 TaxID=3025503 RepID=UPI002FCDD793
MTARAAVLVAISLALASGALCAQQMYKWKDNQGVVHYSDTPPPAQEKKVEVKDFSAPAMTPAVPLPYALAQAVKNNPVTLYTTGNCVPCDQARKALFDRGVPFSEKTVANDADRASLAAAGGKDTVPFITIGRTTLAGYGVGELQAALTEATYPLTKRLPAGYQNPPVQHAAPAVVAAPKPAAPVETPTVPAAPPPSPTGIRF